MIKSLIEKLKFFYNEKNYLMITIYSLSALFASFTVLALTYFVGINIIGFLTERYEATIFIVGGYTFLYIWWKDKQKRKQAEQDALNQNLITQQSAEEKALCESNYETVRQCLFSTLSECFDILNLLKPERLSQLDSPSRTILKGNVFMCQFVVVKKGEAIPDKIKEMLQLRIAQKLTALEFAGITQTKYIYNGKAYPILCIDEVKDNGTFVQIDIAWACENYCNLLATREQAKLQNLQPKETNCNDRDF